MLAPPEARIKPDSCAGRPGGVWGVSGVERGPDGRAARTAGRLGRPGGVWGVSGVERGPDGPDGSDGSGAAPGTLPGDAIYGIVGRIGPDRQARAWLVNPAWPSLDQR